MDTDMDTVMVEELHMDLHSQLMEQMYTVDMEDMKQDMDMDMEHPIVTAREILPVHSMMAPSFNPMNNKVTEIYIYEQYL